MSVPILGSVFPAPRQGQVKTSGESGLMDTWGLTTKSLGLRSPRKIAAAKLSMEGENTVPGHSQTSSAGLAHEQDGMRTGSPQKFLAHWIGGEGIRH